MLEPDGGIGGPAWPYMLYIGLIVAPIGTWCVIEVGRRLPGAVASVAFLLVPAFGVLVSTLWLDEPMGWDMAGGRRADRARRSCLAARRDDPAR